MNAETFWANVARGDGCWLWRGSVDHRGYGRLTWRGKNWRLAHRVSYEMANGDAGALCVCHRCDTPLCVNPAHLFLGTRAQNNADMTAKGRQARGDRHGSKTKPDRVPRGERSGRVKHPERYARIHDGRGPETYVRGDDHWARKEPHRIRRGERASGSKLTASDVRDIRTAVAAGAVKARVAQQYSVTDVLIGKICRREAWSHVP